MVKKVDLNHEVTGSNSPVIEWSEKLTFNHKVFDSNPSLLEHRSNYETGCKIGYCSVVSLLRPDSILSAATVIKIF